jgi:CTP synthase|tara:strand:- start:932 stop:2551 length:1620 start_codon:yes stop_codon:yes gene_type:complete
VKLIFVTGGVVSSLGKGIVTASLASLLRSRGVKLKIRKLDPYLNVDPGTMSPYQHGEVYVTDDGYETDLDLGHYERFTDITCSKNDSISSGKIYSTILAKERRGEYLGSTVQVIPHVTEEIKKSITKSSHKDDVIICEIGGTVGDIESLPFLEAIRQFKNESQFDTLLIHLTLLPYIETSGEVKTKPTQHSVKELLNSGIQPDVIVCRSNQKISKEEIQKISLFCNVPSNAVIPSYDVNSIYQVPQLLSKSKLDDLVIKKLKIKPIKAKNLTVWENFEILESKTKEDLKIFIIGKYVHLKDSYKSLYEAIYHAGIHNQANVMIKWIDSETINKKNVNELLKSASGILIPGGFGNRGIPGKLEAIKFARENNVPFLGICLGMQLTIIEYVRNVIRLKNSGSSEFGKYKNNIISLMTEWNLKNKKIKRSKENDLGATMRLGAYPCFIKKNSLASKIYRKKMISERHRHRYEVNPKFKSIIERGDLIFSGFSKDKKLLEIVENKNHKWFLAVQYHPELKSKPFKPHPIFLSFIKNSLTHKNV